MTSQTSLVQGVDFVTISTTDLPAAMDFYENVLGLEPSIKYQRPGEQAIGAEFETGSLTLSLLDSGSARARGPGQQPPDRPARGRRGGGPG